MTELRDFAWRVVTTDSIDEKLAPPPGDLTDEHPALEPGTPLPEAPGRPPELQIVPVEAARVPALPGMNDDWQRGRIIHAFANHELQAAELFALALLAFPDAPPAFRRGLLRVLQDEQFHTTLYIRRLGRMGLRFGEYPVSGYFWNKTGRMTTPAAFVSAMSLTFENANLDHTLEYAAAARAAGDEETAALLDRVHGDEINHVRFGWTWLERFREDPSQSMWDAWNANIDWPLRAARARGQVVHHEPRRAAGMSDEFIRQLETAGPDDATDAPPRKRRD
ncbi:MAG: DUF455 family protein [Planctomycetota bacterium]